MIRTLKSKDYSNFIYYCSRRDKFSDFYIIEEKNKKIKRRLINNTDTSKKIFNDCLRHGDKAFIVDEGDIKGVLIITGFANKFPRKYARILADTNKDIYNLLNVMIWNTNIDLYIKVKIGNPILKQAFHFGFRTVATLGKEKILFRKYNKDYKKVKNYGSNK